MIPKIIHYCWFGRNPKPKLAEKCIKSWKKYCPDYELIEWNEDNFDISSAPLYVRQAYERKKWAFVTDYVRLWAMTQYGGIYMDTDVEVVKPLDCFLHHEAFSGFENDVSIPTGIMACQKDFTLFQDLLKFYDTACFLDADGKEITIPNVRIITEHCLKYGLKQNGEFQVINGFALYPREYFCPLDYVTLDMHRTADTATIHWFSGSWLSEFEQRELERERDRLIKEKWRRPLRIVARFILGDKGFEAIKNLLRGRRK